MSRNLLSGKVEELWRMDGDSGDEGNDELIRDQMRVIGLHD